MLRRQGVSMDSPSFSAAPISSSLPGAATRFPPPQIRRDFRDEAKLPIRPHKLDEIENSPKHKLTLLDWKDQLTASSHNMARKLSSRNSSISDLYTILGLFFVFQGVIITAVAQAAAIKCRQSWLMFALSLLATVATFFACMQKMKEIALGTSMYLEQRDICSCLHNSIENLKEAGVAFNLEENQPKFPDSYTDRRGRVSGWPGLFVQVRAYWKTWVWSYEGGVFFVLLAFSGVTLAAVHLIVCDPQRNKA